MADRLIDEPDDLVCRGTSAVAVPAAEVRELQHVVRLLGHDPARAPSAMDERELAHAESLEHAAAHADDHVVASDDVLHCPADLLEVRADRPELRAVVRRDLSHHSDVLVLWSAVVAVDQNVRRRPVERSWRPRVPTQIEEVSEDDSGDVVGIAQQRLDLLRDRDVLIDLEVGDRVFRQRLPGVRIAVRDAVDNGDDRYVRQSVMQRSGDVVVIADDDVAIVRKRLHVGRAANANRLQLAGDRPEIGGERGDAMASALQFRSEGVGPQLAAGEGGQRVVPHTNRQRCAHSTVRLHSLARRGESG